MCIPVAANAIDNAALKRITDNNSLAISSEERITGEEKKEATWEEEEDDIFDPEKLVSDKEASRAVSSNRSAGKNPSRALQDIIQFALTTIEVIKFAGVS